MKGITPFLWFDDQAEEAAHHYVSIFKEAGQDSEVTHVSRYTGSGAEAAGRPEGSVMTVSFRLGGQNFVGLNGGPVFQFTEATSFAVNCETQDEIDHFWGRLSDGGEEGVCGWLKDRYGLSWQIVAADFERMMEEGTPEQNDRAMAAILEMKKLDIDEIRRAYEGV
jgi:predicted 3-demethylubiquinone-9 3-methyltransferase (glyoxalase superfamily)